MHKLDIKIFVKTYPPQLIVEFVESLILTSRCRVNVLSKLLNHSIATNKDSLDVELGVITVIGAKDNIRKTIYRNMQPYVKAFKSQGLA